MKTRIALAARIASLQAAFWAIVVAILEAILRRRTVLGWAAALVPLGLASLAAFLVGRLVGLALTGAL
jgi:hypothetical protein